uniref:RING-type domain-containing protein n=1 Tax=Monodelphis domestica TaxID=13616 RepID=A0A5F8G8M4_MONDO
FPGFLFESLKVDLTCPICLRYFTEPVINTCGHNFCRECLQSEFDRRFRAPNDTIVP